MTHLYLAAIAATLAVFLTPLVRILALRLGVVDRPGRRRVHATPTPRLGGLAVLGAVLGTCAIAAIVGIDVLAVLTAGGWRVGWLLAGVLVIVATGTLDDTHGLRARVKLALVTLAAVIAAAGGFGLDGFTEPITGTYVRLGGLGWIVTVCWIVLVTNAFNLVDGLDGLAAGVALIASSTLLAVSLLEGREPVALLWAILGGALVGFLPYNFFPARIFLGDSGSLLLGYLLAVLAVQSLEKGATLVVILVPVLTLGLPVTEIVSTVLRRTASHGAGSIFRADRGHIHHRLLGDGLSHRAAVLVLYVVAAALGAFAFLAVVTQGAVNAVVVGIAGTTMFVAIRWFGRRGRPDE